jgi:uncharacterized protein with HEPN domain
MSSREVRKLLFDVEKACRLIEQFMQGRDVETFLDDSLLQSAVESQTEIIGEALRQAEGLDASIGPHLPDVRKIIALRNRLAHGYASISPQIVWSVAANDVPRLREQVRTLLAEG